MLCQMNTDPRGVVIGNWAFLNVLFIKYSHKISLASSLWDIGKQNSPRSICLQIFIEK